MPGGGPIPCIVPEERDPILAVLDLRQIADVVIGELRQPFERIGELRDQVEGIEVNRPLAERVAHAEQPSTYFLNLPEFSSRDRFLFGKRERPDSNETK